MQLITGNTVQFVVRNGIQSFTHLLIIGIQIHMPVAEKLQPERVLVATAMSMYLSMYKMKLFIRLPILVFIINYVKTVELGFGIVSAIIKTAD